MNRCALSAAIVSLLFFVTTHGFAQAKEADEPITPAQIAAAKAEAAKLIAAAQAGDVFVDESNGALARVRHIKSGLICEFDPQEGANHVTVYPSEPTQPIPRGDDVSCGLRTLDITVSTYVTRYPTRISAADIVRQSSGAIAQQFTDLNDYKGQGVSLKKGQNPGDKPPSEHATMRLTAKMHGKPVFTRSAAATCGLWTVAQRVSAPLDKAMAADLMAELELNSAIESVCNAQPVKAASSS